MEGGAEWYHRWFGEEYLELYPHRDASEAEMAVRLFLRDAPPRGPVLDLACGAGRHLRFLAVAGRDAVGLDLSAPLLRRARREAPAARLVRGDMRRLPFAGGTFAGVASFFTSFGYFETEEEDARVLREVRRVLRPGGVYLLDFLNARRVRDRLVPEDSRRIGGRLVRQSRRIEDDRVVKRIEIGAGRTETVRTYEERVRLYEPEELRRMLARAGLPVERTRGDYRGAVWGPGSPRLILMGRAA